MGELNDDLLTYAVTDVVGWQRRVLDQPLDVSVGAAVDAAVDPPDEVGAWARCIATRGATDEVRRMIGSWEDAWLERFEAWLAANLAARGQALAGVTPRLVALAITLAVEGHLWLDQVVYGPAVDQWWTGRGTELGVLVDRIVGDLTVSGPADGDRPAWSREDASPPRMGTSAAKAAVLDRAVDALRSPGVDGHPAAPSTRIVDPARLARRLSVSERRVFDIWPTATDLNVDVLDALWGRLLVEFKAIADVSLADPVPPERGRDIVRSVEGLGLYLALTTAPGRTELTHCAAVMRDPQVRAGSVTASELLADPTRLMFMALFFSTGEQLRDGVGMDEFLGSVRAAGDGARRLVVVRPELLEEQTTFGDQAVSQMGLALHLVVRAQASHPWPFVGA